MMMNNNNLPPFGFFPQLNASFLTKRNPFMDPSIVMSSLSSAVERIMQNPEKQQKIKDSLHQCSQQLAGYILGRMKGEAVTPPVVLSARDKRFHHEQWESNLMFDVIKQSYLVFSQWLDQTLNDESLELDPNVKKQIRFYCQQMIHAMSPNNFAFLNPSVIEEAYKTSGASVMKGWFTMINDLQKGKDPDMTDMNHFKLGENLATSKGAVVFRNDLIELIQYTPTTDTVYKRPLLIVPPWINKYYVFDLTEEKSMVKWLLDQGRTVFMISWINPDKVHRYKTMESYVLEGPKTAIEVILRITQADRVDAMGYCLGGTLLVCLAAYLSVVQRQDMASLTLLTTLTDFSDAGDLTTFMSEDYVQRIEGIMHEDGYLNGRIMARTFNMLRPSELVWSYVVNNYYLGKDPVPLDFLYWNSDNTNMPEAMHSNLLRYFYQQNRLATPGKYKIAGEGIDLSKIQLPIYMMSTKEDHIAPWKATYQGINLMSNADITFVLGGSGHVAGVINPPIKEKYGYALNPNLKVSAEEWEADAQQYSGSWWIHWSNWLRHRNDEKVLAFGVGSEEYPVLCEAPGSYALKLCDPLK